MVDTCFRYIFEVVLVNLLYYIQSRLTKVVNKGLRIKVHKRNKVFIFTNNYKNNKKKTYKLIEAYLLKFLFNIRKDLNCTPFFF